MVHKKFSRRNFIKGLFGAGILHRAELVTLKIDREENVPKIREYRTLGRTGFKVSDIGCGPILIREELILKELLKRGVNFINSAENFGRPNEVMIGKAIKEFNRKSLFITTMLMLKEAETKDDIMNRARKCMERLQTDYIDCLMIHAAASTKEVKDKEFHKAAKQLKIEERVRSVGISCHGASWGHTPEESMKDVLGAAIEDGRFDLLLLVYNFIQQEEGQQILKACRMKNIGTTLMKTNPFGGSYSYFMELKEKYESEGKEVPLTLQEVDRKFREKQAKAGPFIEKYKLSDKNQIRDAAIRFVLNNPDVHSVLITYRNFDDVETYVGLSGSRLTDFDQKKLVAYSHIFNDSYCRHACGKCESQCPHGVPINTIMRFHHYFISQNLEKFAMQQYAKLRGPSASLCSDCSGYCEAACPYEVSIHALLSIAHFNLTLG